MHYFDRSTLVCIIITRLENPGHPSPCIIVTDGFTVCAGVHYQYGRIIGAPSRGLLLWPSGSRPASRPCESASFFRARLRRRHAKTCVDICVDMHVDMCVDMCVDMHVDMCVDMHVDMCVGML